MRQLSAVGRRCECFCSSNMRLAIVGEAARLVRGLVGGSRDVAASADVADCGAVLLCFYLARSVFRCRCRIAL